MKKMKRVTILILIWVMCFLVAVCGLALFSTMHSTQLATETIRDVLDKVSTEYPLLLVDDYSLRADYLKENLDKGSVISILQDHGLEKTVPDEAHLKEYADLLGASYMEVRDPAGKKVAGTGTPDPNADEELIIAEDMLEDRDVFRPTVNKTGISGYERDLKDGYRLYYEISNDTLDEIAEKTFSWRTILSKIDLPENASVAVVLRKDGTILVHPEEKVVGKKVTDLGYKSFDAFRDSYEEPDEKGVSWGSGTFVLGAVNNDLDVDRSIITGMVDFPNVYVVCAVSVRSLAFYVSQALRTFLSLFIIGSLLVFCYIMFLLFDDHRRREDAAEDKSRSSAEAPDPIMHRRSEFDGLRLRKLTVCSLIVLLFVGALAVQIQLLSGFSQTAGENLREEKVEKTAENHNQVMQSTLDQWLDQRNLQLVDIAAYLIQKDEQMKTRPALKEIADALGLKGIFVFGQDGKVVVTSTNYDHLDLHEVKETAMGQTLLPLLDGLPKRAWTPLGTEHSIRGSTYAGISIRNKQDLCDGCIGISTDLPADLITGEGTLDICSDILKWAAGAEDDIRAPLSGYQVNLIIFLLIVLGLCLLLMSLVGSIRRRFPKEDPETGESAEPEAKKTMAETAEHTLEAAIGSAKGSRSLFKMTRHNQDKYFYQRWNREMTPLRDRSPEKKLGFLIYLLILAVACLIVWLYITNGATGNESSITYNLFRGNWTVGRHFFAFIAAEMLLLVVIVAANLLRRMIFLIAYFCSPRGETICQLISSLVAYAMIFLGVFYALRLFGIDSSTLLVSAGVLTAIIGFGANAMIADILAGIFLIFEDVIHVGDLITVDTTEGTVVSIGVRMTKLNVRGAIVSVNNADLKNVKNHYAGNGLAFANIMIDFEEDLNSVEEIIKRELPTMQGNLEEAGFVDNRMGYGGVSALDSTGYKLVFIAACHPDKEIACRCSMNGELLKMCNRNGIRVAYQHVIVDASE